MILAPFQAACSAVTYTAITIINTLGNLTSPVFNWGSPERKFSINDDIEKLPVTMNDFDSKIAGICQRINSNRTNFIGNPKDNIFTKFNQKVIFNKIDDIKLSLNNVNYHKTLLSFEKVKVIYDIFYLEDSGFDTEPNLNIINNRVLSDRNGAYSICNENLNKIESMLDKLFNKYKVDETEKNSIIQQINDAYDEDDNSGNSNTNDNIINNFKKKLKNIKKESSPKLINDCLIYVSKVLGNLIKVDIMFLKGENRNWGQITYDFFIGAFANLSRFGMSYSMAYSYYELYLKKVIEDEIISTIKNKNNELSENLTKFTKSKDIFYDLDLIIQPNINDEFIFYFNNNPNVKYNIKIGGDNYVNPALIVDKINDEIRRKYTNQIRTDISDNDNNQSGNLFHLEFVKNAIYNGINPLKILILSNQKFTIDRESSILPYINLKNSNDHISWRSEIKSNKSYDIMYNPDKIDTQFINNITTGCKNNKIKAIGSLLIQFCNNLGRVNIVLNQ